jgi:hypothetical protein
VSVTVYRAREIVTLDANCPSAEAVAVSGERILHVGTHDEVVEALRDRTFETDLRYAERVIVPGFIEAHGHITMDGALGQLVWTGFDDRPRPDGTPAVGCRSIEEVVERLREHANGDKHTIVAYGFDPVLHDGRPLRREDLDRVSTTQGVLVVNASGHLAYANSLQMQRNGVGSSTTAAGVMKDANGDPTGEFHETAMALVFDDMSVLAGDPERAMRDGGELLRQAGVTSGSDMALFAAGDAFDTYARVANEPTFPVRVFYSPHLGAMSSRFSNDELLAHLASLRDQGTDRYALGPLKLIADGSIQGFTGKLKWPGYCSGEDHGFLILDEDAVVATMTPFHDAGYQMAIHTNGDEATEVVLRAIDRVLEHSPRRDHRHRLEHCQMASRAMMRRMAVLGVGANLFSNHIYYWGDIHRTKTMGPDKARRMNAAHTALDEGIAISLHSDHPVTPVNPLFTMWCAVNRRTRSGHELGAAEKITPLQALTAVTLGSAYLIKRDEDLGSIEVGKYADLTILEDNPLSVDPMAIKDIAVVGTVVAGRPV